MADYASLIRILYGLGFEGVGRQSTSPLERTPISPIYSSGALSNRRRNGPDTVRLRCFSKKSPPPYGGKHVGQMTCFRDLFLGLNGKWQSRDQWLRNLSKGLTFKDGILSEGTLFGRHLPGKDLTRQKSSVGEWCEWRRQQEH